MQSDHKNLNHIRDTGSKKVLKWKIAIQECIFDIVHVAGVDNVVADKLSRNTLAENATDYPEDEEELILWAYQRLAWKGERQS